MRLGDFAPNGSSRVRLSRLLKGKEVVLRGISALKYMELFDDEPFAFEEPIFVYAKERLLEDNLMVKMIDNFDLIDYNEDWDIACSTLNQVVNDMLSEPELMHRDALVESLANYYEDEGSFEDIEVCESKKAEFEELKALALVFYDA